MNVTSTIEESLPFMAFHTTDAWHDVPSNWQGTHGQQEHQDHELDDAPHFLHEAPETIRHLYDEFLYQGLIDGPRLSEAIHVRSWYLHHLRQRHWDAPRVLELDGHWRHWARDIAGGWRDQINVDEDIAFYICRPDPPRNVAIEHEIFFDLIVAQGIDVNEWAGLITVIRTDDIAARAEFSRAVSLPQFVSGEHLAMLVGRAQQCHLRGCRIAHARTEIPFTHEPVHEMTNGDAFIIQPRRSQAAAAPTPAVQGEELADLDYDTCGDQLPEHAPDEDAAVSEGYSPSSEAPDDMQGTHIYRLGQIAIFGHLDWRSYHAALRDAAQLLRMSINQFVGFHYAQVHLPGHDAGDEAIIMQHVNDIQPGSLEKLVIIDIVYHTNRLVHGVPDNPTVTREVYKLPPQIVRQHLLIFAQVASYCTWRSDQCVVHHNDREWYRTDQRLRDISHGAVFRIQLPPPPRAEWQIGQAVRVAHETGELFDFPAAGDLAYAIMNGQIDANRQDYDGTSTTGARVVQCKGSDHVEDIDIPMTFPPGVQVPRVRPRHDGVFTWLYDLAEFFRQDAEAEVFDGDPLLYVQTWYVHHQRYKRCHRPRAVRLDGAMIGWIEEFRQTWNDILDHNIPFGLHVVRPRPPRPRLQSYSCHVIVEQAPLPHRAAGVISVLFEGPERDALQQFAGSFPQLINRPHVIEELGLQPQCDLRRCSVQANGEPVHLILMTALSGGFNVCVRIESVDAQRPIPPSEEDAHFEDLVLMQLHTDAATASGPQQPEPVHDAPCNVFAFNPAAQPFVPGNVQLNAMSEFVQDLHDLWETVAFAWEDEPRSSLFTTWFADHAGDFRHCTTPRNVELSEDFTTWELTLRQRWHDFLRDDSPLEYYIVQPNPPHLQPNVAGHIILVYHEHEVMVTSLVTLIDHTLRENHGRFQQMAVTTHEQIYLADLLEVVGYAQICLPPDAPRVCRAWYMDERFRDGKPLMGRSGYGIHINVQRRVYPGDAAAFLQRPTRHQDEGFIRERQTQGQVAHTPGPRLPLHLRQVPPKQLALAELLPTTELMTEPIINLEHEIVRDAAVKLRSGSSDLVVPSFLEVPCAHDESWIAHILLEWGINCNAYRFGGHDEYLCLPLDWSTTEQHVIYGTQDGIEDGAAFLHTWNAAHGPLHALGHMKVLYKIGYIKTAIIEVVDVRPGLCRVVFAHLQPKLAAPVIAQKLPSEWPLPQPVGRDAVPPFDPATWQAECNDCCLAFGISLEALQEVFVPDSFPLCTTLDGLDLPPTTRQFVEDLQPNPDLPLSHFDRIVVYAEGSSLSALRHQPPLFLAEKGQADTWAFIVIGEVQASDGNFQRYLIGWQAQPVLYDEQNRAFIGTTHAGSDAAEREALFWSMMWRISINDSVSTTFCTDSQLTQAQANGVVGSHQSTESFQLLRGEAQTLAAILPHDKLLIQHVKGHSNDPLNDFVDFAAKAEREKSFYLPRPKFSLCNLRKFIPYMWMLFHKQAGLPRLCRNGFHAPPPKLPETDQSRHEIRDAPSQWRQFTVCPSFATANVQSLYRGDNGHAGKVQYLRSQFVLHRLNFLGIQEARTDACCSCVDEVLRLASGAERGHHGVELWVNLKCPIGFLDKVPQYLKRHDFVVVHAKPRWLMVRVQHSLLKGPLVVAHAPQSGCPRVDREEWWTSFSQTLEQCKLTADESVFCMIDANAATGPRAFPHVGDHDDGVTASTNLLRDFLYFQDLCLPASHPIHRGSRTTWFSPDGQHECRIDYVVVPCNLLPYCTFSCVLPDFDLGTVHLDHLMSALQLSWQTWQQVSASGDTSTKPRYDRRSLQRGSLTSVLCQQAANDWTDDIDTHVAAYTQNLMSALVSVHPPKKACSKKPYIDSTIWTLRQDKLNLSKSLRGLHRRFKLESLFRSWRLWRGQMSQQECALAHNYETTLRCIEVKLIANHFRVTRYMRTLLKRSKHVLLAEKLKQLPPATAASTVLKEVHGIVGPTNPKKIKRRSLPLVRKEDGHICADPQEMVDRWVEFFAAMEGGTRMSHNDHRHQWRQNLQQFCQEDFHLCLQDLPTLCDLERAFARVRTGKAIGHDQVPPEACAYNAAELARLSYSQLLKLALHGQEAAMHKGGQLVQAHKGKGPMDLCESYRSLLIS